MSLLKLLTRQLLLLALLAPGLKAVPAYAQEPVASLREEQTLLENVYHQKVRTVLDNLMNPQDYTLVISATLKSDDAKLKEYNDAVEKKFLPGLPMGDPMGFSDTNNILLEMKQKIEIQVILSERVPVDRDGIVKDILKNKLHLNEEAGDTITVIRAAMTVLPQQVPEARKFPELSPKMIAFWIIVCMMVLTACIFWWQRRKEKQKEAQKAEQAIKIEQEHREAEKKDEEDSKDQVQADKDAADRLKELQKEELFVKIAVSRPDLINLMERYPAICAIAAEEFVNQGNLEKALIVLETIGWDESKKLLNDVDGRFWTKIAEALRARTKDPEPEEIYEAIQVFHRFALSYVLERTSKEGNPFAFIFQLTSDQRLDLLIQESPENIALIGVYCTGAQMGELLEGLDTEKQNKILFHLTKIKQLPEANIKMGVADLLDRLDKIKADPSVYADGPMLASDFLRSLPASREEELVQFLMADHPTEGEKLRRVRVLFSDILQYPVDTVRKIVEETASEDIQRALVGFDPGFVDSFLELLPTKKALMIQNDLFHMSVLPPISQCADSRRKICAQIETEFERQKFNLEEYWKSLNPAAEPEASTGGEVTKEYPRPEARSMVSEDVPLEEIPEAKVEDLLPEDEEKKAA